MRNTRSGNTVSYTFQRAARSGATEGGIGFWDYAQEVLDAGGVFEPTPFCDLTSAAISAFRGNWTDAGLSLAGVIPYVGDVGKLAKYGNKAVKAANAVDTIADTTRLADRANDIRKAGSLGPSEALMAGTRRSGTLYGETQLGKLERYLQRRNVTLVRDSDVYLDSVGGSGLFRAQRDSGGVLFLRSNPTRYEVLHELGHFTDARRLGFESYQAIGNVGREQSVYDALRINRNWNMFNQAEREHAFEYILNIGGNPLGR